MKVLITGGHITPALAVIEELKSKSDVDIVFVGRKHAQEGESSLSLEYKEIEKRGIRFIPLQAGRLTRVFSASSFKNLLKVPYGFARAYQILRKEQPRLVLSFGGYVALPVAYAAYILKIPVFTHEQTVRPGMANLWIARIAKKVFISFEDSRKFFQKAEVVLTGNPVRKSTFKVTGKSFTVPGDRPVLYITGGSLGSHSINMHVKVLLPELLKKYTVIHQTGDVKKYDDYVELNDTRTHLPQVLRDRYFLREHFFEEEIGYVYSKADLVIGRSGANTFFELIALKKPAILIPLPWSAYNEQEKQATLFAGQGLGEVFHQSGSSRDLMKLIDTVVGNLKEYKENFNKLQFLYKEDAAETIAGQVMAA